MIIRNLSLIALIFFTCSVVASDFFLRTNISIGQGVLYPHDESCYVVTPSHVVLGSNYISGIDGFRKVQDFEVKKEFDPDLAILESQFKPTDCSHNYVADSSKLDLILTIYNSGVLKTRLDDGSILQTNVEIVGVDNSEFLQIKPTDKANRLK